MNTIPEARRFAICGQKKLRRARRLYIRIIRPAVMLDRTGKNLKALAKRMKATGLYSMLGHEGNIQMRILQTIYAIDMAGCESSRVIGFHDWVHRNGWRGHGYCGYTRVMR